MAAAHITPEKMIREERRSTGALLLAIVLTAALVGGVVYRWHYVIVRNVQDEARAVVSGLQNEVTRLTEQLQDVGALAGDAAVITREHVVFHSETPENRSISYDEYFIPYPRSWSLERDTEYAGSGIRAIFKDHSKRRVMSMTCPIPENVQYDNWLFEKTARTVRHKGVSYRVELWEGTPRSAPTVPRWFMFVGPVGSDERRLLDPVFKVIKGCQFSSVDTSFDTVVAQGMDVLFQSLEIR